MEILGQTQEETQGDETILDLCGRSLMGHKFSGSLSFLPWHHVVGVAVLRNFIWGSGSEDIESGNRIASISCKYVYFPFCFPGHSGLQPTGNAL